MSADQNNETSIRGIKSIEKMMFILQQFLERDAYSLKDLAQLCDCTTASLSPYLKSMMQLNLIKKTNHGMYQLGNHCLELGIQALEISDPFLDIEEAVNKLFYETQHGIMVSAWGPLGPAQIRVKHNVKGLYPELRLGGISSIVNTSVGKLFAANMPYLVIKDALQTESQRYHGNELNDFEIDDFMNKVPYLEKNIQINHQSSSNLSSISVPIFEISGRIKFVISLFHKTHILMVQEHFLTEKLLQVSQALSKKLGY